MRIRVADPLALLAIQAGKVPTPATERGAAGDSQLDSPQRAIRLGEPVPIVFGRRRNDAGGVFISPGATEARFENDLDNDVTAFYHLVLSEGQIDSIQVRDVFQRACRVGSFSQTYNRRAGTWTPENAIVARSGFAKPEAPYFCGSIGSYPGISTMSFQVTVPNGFDQWNRQVHCFVRGGYRLQRLADGVTGPSDNFADLVLLAWRRSRRVPDALIDLDGMEAAADFLEANQFRCNAWIQQSTNLADFVSRWAPFFLLGQGKKAGKTALRPLLPVNSDGTIKTTAINWVYLFTEDLIIPGTEELRYSSLADRQPFVAQMTWRQEVGSDVAIIRTSEVAYAGTAEVGPYESYDLSEFCTSENHAVKVGAHILSRRMRSTHTLRFQVKPEAHSTVVSEGSIVRVRLQRETPGTAPSEHDYLYQVEKIGRTLAGNISYECSHFPVDDQGRSLIAMDVTAATGTGILLTSNKTGVSCDVNSSGDTSIPIETFTLPISDFELIDIPTDEPGFVDPGIGGPVVPDGGGISGGGGTGPELPIENPTDEEEYSVGIYFYNAIWIGSTLTVRMRLAPTGRAPRFDLGPLDVTIASTSVVALLPNGVLASPQPETLPTVSFTGQIAAPWDAEDEGAPFPPGDRIFEGQFVIDLGENGAPPIAEDPSEQLTYRAAIEFTEWEGGFTDVAFLNTLNVESTGGQFVVWFDGESARVFPADVATIALVGSEGDYETGEHLGEATFAPPPGVLDVSLFYHSWDVDIPDLLTAADFTIEAWMRSGDASPALGETGIVGVEMVWGDGAGIYFNCFAGWSDIASPGTLAEQHEAYFASQYEGSAMWSSLLFGETVQGWKHFCYQRINGEDVFHYHGTRINLTDGDESLPVIRPVTPDAQLNVYAENQALSGVGLGQVRVSSGALYGTGTFTPPSVAFYDAPGGDGTTFYEVDTIWVIYSAGEIVDDIIEIGPYAGNSGFLVSSDSIRRANGDIIIGPDTIDLFDIWSISTTDPTPP